MNSITFYAPSGAPASGTVIQQLDPPGSTSGANHIGFFGAGGPEGVPFAVIVSNYQDKTFITNTSGNNLGVAPYGLLASGELINHKFVNSSTASITPGVGSVALTSVPVESGTVLVVFEASGAVAVQTQNGFMRTVALNSASGIDDVTDIVSNITVQSYECAADSSWTTTGGTGAASNALFLTDHNDAALRHDFYIGLSASPEAVGQRNDWGFFFILEFL